MTTYHVTGNLYFLKANATQANTLYTNINTKATTTGAAFTNVRNFNKLTKTTLADGTVQIQFSTRYNAQTNRDVVVAYMTTAQIAQLNLAYCSYLEYHKCHHDEGVLTGIESPIITKWGACEAAVI